MLPDVLLTIMGWVLTALGAAALAWFVLGDRLLLRGVKARRCPKCWYDLSHTPGLRCSECGYGAKRERQLHRARRQRRWVAAAMLIFIAANLSLKGPAIKARGWFAAVPTTVLVLVIPQMEAFVSDDESGSIWGEPATGWLRFLIEVENRLAADELTLWQRDLLVKSALYALERRPLLNTGYARTAVPRRLLNNVLSQRPCAPSPDLTRALALPAINVRTREKWPRGEQIHASYDIRVPPGAIAVRCTARSLTPGLEELFMSAGNAWLSEDGSYTMQFPTYGGMGWWFDRSVPIGSVEGTMPGLLYECEFECNYERSKGQGDVVTYARRMDIPCEIVASIDEILQPVESKEFEASLNDLLNPMLIPGGVSLNIDDLDEAFRYLDGATFAVAIEVISGESVVARGEAWWRAPRSADSPPGRSARSRTKVVLDHPGGGWPRPIFAPGEYRLRLTSSPSLALRDFESDRYWKGRIEMPAGMMGEGSSD